MARSAALLLLAAVAGFVILPRLADAGPQEAELPPAERIVVVRAASQEPFWDTLTIRDETPALVLTVPEGKRFVLTDMWLMPVEEDLGGVHPLDRIWLENRREGKNFIVFDTYAKNLDLPLRWNTGVLFAETTQMWMYWDFNPGERRLRRVHYTGYFEELPAPAPVR